MRKYTKVLAKILKFLSSMTGDDWPKEKYNDEQVHTVSTLNIYGDKGSLVLMFCLWNESNMSNNLASNLER